MPDDQQVELNSSELAPGLAARWVNPLSGEYTSATPAIGDTTYQFTTPAPGDWVLVLQAAT